MSLTSEFRGKPYGMQNYREKSPKHNIGKQDTLENNPLHDACRKGDLGRVKRILSRGVVDVNSRDKKLGRTPLMMAAQKGHRRIFDLLMRKGANVTLVNAYGNNILHWACLGGHIAMVRYVLSQYSVDVNSRTKAGSTPLMKAAYCGHRDVSDYLVCMGANISLVDEDGDSILHWACRGGHAKMVQHILAQGLVNITSRGIYGRTPLMIAANYGHREVFDILLNEGAQISSVDSNGDNILHLASFGGNVEMVKHILSQNLADINARDKDGDTAAMMAHRKRHRAVYDLLVSIGCPVQ
ncbi:ankyrin-1-like [Haliotis rufescens]|uniref:ankyrin-1-like n=1 Tax=Haliotis rufescens TaxID=6454 RepID=UPI00201F5695|nr:ankyrin-1-like [Haliotis rufescens]